MATRWRSSPARRDGEASTRGQSDDEARQIASSWSRNDHEDGGPTIQLPAAEVLLHPSSPRVRIQYLRPSNPVLDTSCVPRDTQRIRRRGVRHNRRSHACGALR
jgi:hypothetical protein